MAPLVFICSWIVAGAIRDGYDPVEDAISRLAELGAPNRWIVTIGIVAFGLGALAFAASLRKPAALALAVAGVASFAVALFPCTEGCPGPGSFTDTAHVVAAGVFYVSFVLVPVLQERSPTHLVVAGFAGIALALHGIEIGPNGLLQRIGLTLLDAWMIATAARYARTVTRDGE